MKRGGFKRRVYSPAPSPAPTAAPAGLADRVRIGPAVLRAVPKPVTVVHEGYRRLVRSFPCLGCGAHGRSQFAHANQGKGMGLKSDDRWGFPLCRPTFGAAGCHAEHDQHGLVEKAERREKEARMAAATRAAIRLLGMWPRDLDVPAEDPPIEEQMDCDREMLALLVPTIREGQACA